MSFGRTVIAVMLGTLLGLLIWGLMFMFVVPRLLG
jgi:hypothetical protein